MAAAVGEQAQRDGVAKLRASGDTLFHDAMERIRGAREASRVLLQVGLIPRLADQVRGALNRQRILREP